jgi:hypothetical protein
MIPTPNNCKSLLIIDVDDHVSFKIGFSSVISVKAGSKLDRYQCTRIFLAASIPSENSSPLTVRVIMPSDGATSTM